MIVAALISTALFTSMVILGRLLLFIDVFSLWLIPLFFLALLLMRFFYHEGTCKAIEWKDFLFSFLILTAFILIRCSIGKVATLDEMSYYYLIIFLCLSSHVSSIRYKSLM